MRRKEVKGGELDLIRLLRHDLAVDRRLAGLFLWRALALLLFAIATLVLLAQIF